MVNTKFRHDKVTHANKVTAWKQRQVFQQRLAVAGMYSKLPWYRKLWMKIAVLTTAIKASGVQWKAQIRRMDSMNATYKNYNRRVHNRQRK